MLSSITELPREQTARQNYGAIIWVSELSKLSKVALGDCRARGDTAVWWACKRQQSVSVIPTVINKVATVVIGTAHLFRHLLATAIEHSKHVGTRYRTENAEKFLKGGTVPS